MPRRIQIAAMLAVVIVMLAGAGVALGEHRSGVYRTKPPASHRTFLDFSFTATRVRVKRVKYYFRIEGGCSNGASLVGDQSDFAIPPTRLKSEGRFSVAVHEADGDSLRIIGRLTRHGAQGTFRSRFKVGGVRCDTNTRRWRAYHLDT